MALRDRDFGRAGRFLGFVLIALVLLAILVPVGAFTFSVKVQGHSMEPTLEPGDRLFTNILGRGDIDRFDVIEATVDGNKVVKRVIGVPGDRIVVRQRDRKPVVLLRPAGEKAWQEVVSDAWASQYGDRVGQKCCSADGVMENRAKAFTVPDDHYWLIGDNWGGSDDSRVFGVVAADDIGAIMNRRIQPFSRMGTVDNPASLEPVDE
ncbi:MULTISPECIES: signal peptidase I [unclassified Nocardioides]|uniref:signal peptidase I n=1 Tax=unclassified Nocardioides TaxID=2615069 RepID=UPI0006FD66A8|nr:MULTISPECIES: signal peptidase I [unclassified Nocardioides]KQY57054.1 hypothetical protein ASD30_12390 [Nocardioides sp. Root140]KRF11694.1 hypothetical protein ASH02_17035 [Nocardioides sp. Soil796]